MYIYMYVSFIGLFVMIIFILLYRIERYISFIWFSFFHSFLFTCMYVLFLHLFIVYISSVLSSISVYFIFICFLFFFRFFETPLKIYTCIFNISTSLHLICAVFIFDTKISKIEMKLRY
jgi:hypothetical protein